MSIDLSQFHQTFFEESLEGLETMETGLLNLSPGELETEAVNTLFRVAHSIKGGSAMFGFSAIASLTHVMETLLDHVRAGRAGIDRLLVDALLAAVDCLRETVLAMKDGGGHDDRHIAASEAQLQSLLPGHSRIEILQAPVRKSIDEPEGKDVAIGAIWRIGFRPFLHLFKTGNDPLRLFRALAGAGKLVVSADISRLPAFGDLDPESCYLGWDLTLDSDVGREAIGEVFEWVEGDCNLVITPSSGGPLPEPVLPEVPEADHHKPVLDDPHPSGNAHGEPPGTGSERRQPQNPLQQSQGAEQSSIRVSIQKIDALINLVGELVITQSMLSQCGQDLSSQGADNPIGGRLRDGLAQLARNTRELQESVLGIRMVPISFSFNRFPRLVRDLGHKLCKNVELKVSGENTELDKTVMEKISDPLVHLIRNALDHGIETPEERRAAGKPETGVLHLNAYHSGGRILIEIADDGAGIDSRKILARARARGLIAESDALPEDRIHDLIFQPGFSTAAEVTELSGRGVGLDVVRRNIKDLGGVVEVRSRAGQGSTFLIKLPLTLAILDGQLIRVGAHVYVIPLVSIIESLQVRNDRVSSIAGTAELYQLRNEYLPIVRLYEVLNVVPDNRRLDAGLLVVVEGDGQKAGIHVDDLLAQQQVVIKSLETNYRRVTGISGATILADGTVAQRHGIKTPPIPSRHPEGRHGFARTAIAVSPCFNPRPSLLRGDTVHSVGLLQSEVVSIHAPHCGGATRSARTRHRPVATVSIHAPHCGGATRRGGWWSGRRRPCFNPRPSLLRGDTSAPGRSRISSSTFQSTPLIAEGRHSVVSGG
jgi:two-component system chemotaxis sensor kinase CheA